jgi:hypothetical protein
MLCTLVVCVFSLPQLKHRVSCLVPFLHLLICPTLASRAAATNNADNFIRSGSLFFAELLFLHHSISCQDNTTAKWYETPSSEGRTAVALLLREALASTKMRLSRPVAPFQPRNQASCSVLPELKTACRCSPSHGSASTHHCRR